MNNSIMSAACCSVPYGLAPNSWYSQNQSPVFQPTKPVVEPPANRARRTVVPVAYRTSRTLLVDPTKDYSAPLQVDCSIEYDLPRVAKPPPGSEPLLLIAKPLIPHATSWNDPRKVSSKSGAPIAASLASYAVSGSKVDWRSNPNIPWVSGLSSATPADFLPMRSFKENDFPHILTPDEQRPCPCCQLATRQGVTKMTGTTPVTSRWTPYPTQQSRQMIPAAPQQQQHQVRVTKMNSSKNHMVLWRSIEFQNRSMASVENQIKMRI